MFYYFGVCLKDADRMTNSVGLSVPVYRSFTHILKSGINVTDLIINDHIYYRKKQLNVVGRKVGEDLKPAPLQGRQLRMFLK